jgi:hypothetical protein
MREILHFQCGEYNTLFLGCDSVHSGRYMPTFSRNILPLSPNLAIERGIACKLLIHIYKTTRCEIEEV